MTTPFSSKPMAIRPGGLLPPPFRSPFYKRIRPDLEKVLEKTALKHQQKDIEAITTSFEEAPLQGLSYWLKMVPKKEFSKVDHMESWINLLCALVDRYAVLTKRKQTKGVSWKSRCLRGMLHQLSRLPGKSLDGRDEWKKFTESLIAEAIPWTQNPVTKAAFKKRNDRLKDFSKLGVFLRTGEDVWGNRYDFPLQLLQELNRATVSRLLASGIAHEKRIALFAMRMDLRLQQQEYNLGNDKSIPAWDVLKQLVHFLGDWELAKQADDALGPFQPVEHSLVNELTIMTRDSNSRRRRPYAKPRERKAK